MASTWIVTRTTKDGSKRWRVLLRCGGREAPILYAGSFKRKADALERQRWVAGELARRVVPDLRFTVADTVTLRPLAARWQASRLDVSTGTMQTYRVALGRLLPRLGDRPVDQITRRRSRTSSPRSTPTA